MAIRRIGNTRMPDAQNTAWDITSPNTIPTNALLKDQTDRNGPITESIGPIVTEEHMSVRTQSTPSQSNPKKTTRPKRPKIKAVLPPEANRTIIITPKETASRTAINLRMPNSLLMQYKSMGSRYQTRMIAVLELFLEEGGEFIEV
jgi:uncharacterized protein (DUF4415 family)